VLGSFRKYAEEEIARLAPTDRPRGHAGSEDPLQSLEARAIFTTRSCPLLTSRKHG